MDSANLDARREFEISVRFRQFIEERIARLEGDAANDAAVIPLLENADHIRRQRRLVAAQLEEAVRMRRFLDGSRTRLPRPLMPL